MSGRARTLTPRQARFVEEYLVDLNATQAALRAGYSEAGAEVRGSELVRNRKVAAAIRAAQAARSERTEVTQDWVVERLVENVERAMQRREVVRDGLPSGVYQYEGAVANRALELLGKHVGMFEDRLKVDATVRERPSRLTESERARLLAQYAAEDN